jgi:hypothetical protein
MTRAEFTDALVTYCLLTGASVTSGIRSRAHNAAVAGVAGSAHLYGLAADVIYDAPHTAAMLDSVAARTGLRRLSEADHDHLQPLGWPAG